MSGNSRAGVGKTRRLVPQRKGRGRNPDEIVLADREVNAAGRRSPESAAGLRDATVNLSRDTDVEHTADDSGHVPVVGHGLRQSFTIAEPQKRRRAVHALGWAAATAATLPFVPVIGAALGAWTLVMAADVNRSDVTVDEDTVTISKRLGRKWTMRRDDIVGCEWRRNDRLYSKPILDGTLPTRWVLFVKTVDGGEVETPLFTEGFDEDTAVAPWKKLYNQLNLGRSTEAIDDKQ